MSEKRQFKTTPLIKLGDEHFKKVIGSTSGGLPVKYVQVSKFSGRFKTIPDMLEADHLTVSGDVTFGKDVSLKVIHHKIHFLWSLISRCVLLTYFQGTVIIIANHGDRIDIPSGAILENKIVSGNLRILDH